MNKEEKMAWRRLRRTWQANEAELRAAGITWVDMERTWRLACMDAEAKRLKRERE